MRVNSKVFTEKTDLLGVIQIANCPSQFKSVAERLMMMAMKLGYSITDYNNVTKLDKILLWDYWREYDGMKPILNCDTIAGFRDWFINKATPPDLVSRATRWLVAHNYLILKPEVQERALQASNKWREAIGHD